MDLPALDLLHLTVREWARGSQGGLTSGLTFGNFWAAISTGLLIAYHRNSEAGGY